VGTQATVKAVTPDQLRELGAGLILANAYHLYLRPGDERVAQGGGLHRFMGWDGPILTDSGGFQLFSMADQRTVDDEGVSFRSHLDGSLHRFTPEKAMAVQENLGADIIMALDECAEPLDRAYNEQALARTHAWALRCLQAKTRPDQALFAIVQGGIFTDLRLQSAEFLSGLGTPGLAIGGLSVGESKEQMHAVLEALHPLLPPDLAITMGVAGDLGKVSGVDLFDSVLPPHGPQRCRITAPAGSTCATPLRRRRAPHRSGVWLLHLPPIRPGLPAPPDHRPRDAVGHAALHSQSAHPNPVDRRSEAGDPGWPATAIRADISGPARAGRG
jgi:tRNA-guanine transglycosylase